MLLNDIFKDGKIQVTNELPNTVEALKTTSLQTLWTNEKAGVQYLTRMMFHSKNEVLIFQNIQHLHIIFDVLNSNNLHFSIKVVENNNTSYTLKLISYHTHSWYVLREMAEKFEVSQNNKDYIEQ